MAWDHRDTLAGRHMDIAVGVCEWIVRRSEVSGELERGVDEAVIGIDQPFRRLICGACFKTLAAGCLDVLKNAAPRYRAGHIDDVILAGGMKQADLPFDLTAFEGPFAAQAALEGPRHHLLQRRVRYQKTF